MHTKDLVGLSYNGVNVLSLNGKLGNGAYAFNVEYEGRTQVLRKCEILKLINRNVTLSNMMKQKIGKMIPQVGMIISVRHSEKDTKLIYVVYTGQKIINKTMGELKTLLEKGKTIQLAQQGFNCL